MPAKNREGRQHASWWERGSRRRCCQWLLSKSYTEFIESSGTILSPSVRICLVLYTEYSDSALSEFYREGKMESSRTNEWEEGPLSSLHVSFILLKYCFLTSHPVFPSLCSVVLFVINFLSLPRNLVQCRNKFGSTFSVHAYTEKSIAL